MHWAAHQEKSNEEMKHEKNWKVILQFSYKDVHCCDGDADSIFAICHS